MLSIFGSPARYVQGPDALDTLGTEVAALGASAVLVVDGFVRPLVEDRITHSCREAGVTIDTIEFSGDITAEEVERLVALTNPKDRPQVVIAAGGGKTIDAGKGVAKTLGSSMVSVPTIASNDAPTSRLFVLYDEHHKLKSVDRLSRNPELVLVDTALLIKAPRSLYVSGIGDAIVKKFEVEQCMASGRPNVFGGRSPLIGGVLANTCYEVIRRDAEAALAAITEGVPNDAFERVTEATVLLSGLAFENGGLSVSHGMTRGLSAVRGASHAPHGVQVAYALLVQLILEGRPAAFIDELKAFYRRVELPCSLSDIGLDDPSDAELETIATLSMAAPHTSNFTVPITLEGFVAALRATR